MVDMNKQKSFNIFMQVVAILFFGITTALFLVLREYAIFGLAVLLFFSLVIFMKKPLWPIYLMFFFYPFLYLKISYQDFDIPLADLFGLIGFVSWLMLLSFKIISGKIKLSPRMFPAWLWFGFFFFCASLSLLNTVSLEMSVKYLARPIIFLYAIYILYPYNAVEKKEDFWRIIKITAVSGIISAIISIFYINQDLSGIILRVNPRDIFGLAPLGYNHNLIAEIMLVTSFLTFFIFKTETGARIKKVLVLAIILQLTILLLTFSRSGWIVVFFEIFLFIFFEYKTKLKKIIPALALIFLMLIPLGVLMLKLSVSSIAQSSDFKRWYFIEKSVELFEEHPLIGNGIGTFKDEVLHDKLYLLEFGEDGTNEDHGVIWKLIAETGILGLISYFSILIYLAYILFILRKKQAGISREIISIFLCITLGMTIFQLFQTNYFNQKMWLPLSLAFLVVKFYNQKTGKKIFLPVEK